MNDFPTRVLVATDGSEDATLAARAATDLAGRSGSELHVVHAWHDVAPPHPYRFIESRMELRGRAILDRQVEDIEESGGVVASSHLKRGQAVDAVVELAEEIGADLIVVGSRGRGAVARAVVGSVSTGLAHRSHCPVLIVREGEEAWPPERVLVGYASFEDTERAGFLGASLARALSARVELVGVESDADALRETERGLEARAGQLEEILGERPLVRALSGDVPGTLLEVEGEEEKPALLGLGSRVLGRAGRVMIGNLLDRVLGKARGPILISPEPHPFSKILA